MSGKKHSSKAVAEAAEMGEQWALEAFDFTAQKLGLALANSVAITRPEAVVLFGGLAQAGDLLFVPTKKYMEEKKRLELEILNLKKTHNDKIFEIKQNQALEVERLQDSHRKTIDNAREKFIKEKMKWQTMDD